MSEQSSEVVEWKRKYESLENWFFQSVGCLLGIMAQMYFEKWQIAVPLAIGIYAFLMKFVASKPYSTLVKLNTEIINK